MRDRCVSRACPAPPSFELEEIAPGNFVHYGKLEERTPANLGDQANMDSSLAAVALR
jgi:hypothetical protein